MSQKGIDPAALAAAAFAGAISVFVPKGPYDWPSTIVGLTLIFILIGYDVEPRTRVVERIAFGAVLGLCSILASGILLERLFAWRNAPPDDSNVPTSVVFLIWLALTIFYTILDERGTLRDFVSGLDSRGAKDKEDGK